MSKIIVLWDCDGVLLDSAHRYRTKIDHTGREVIDLHHWKREAARGGAWFDVPLPHAESYRAMLKEPEKYYVIICTSRLMNRSDYLSIEQRIGKPHAYISRKDDKQSGSGLKVAGIKRLLRLRQFRDCAAVEFYDDNIGNITRMQLELQGRVLCHYVPSKQGH
jgi:hypothetical protein